MPRMCSSESLPCTDGKISPSPAHRSQTRVKPVASGEIHTTCSLRTAQDATSGRQVRELRVALEERELLRSGRSVAVLRQDDLGETLLIGLLVVVLVAVDEHDEVGVLLDRAGLAEV